MENDILDSLEDLGYDGPLLEQKALLEAVDTGAKSVAYTQLVEWIISQLSVFCSIDAKVSAIQGPSDSELFLMELSGFLREFSCPYKNLTEGPMDGRLSSRKACLQLLDYLLAELAAVKIIAVKRPAALSTLSKGVNEISEVKESDVAKRLKLALLALKFSKPPPTITAFQLFSKIETKVKEQLSLNPDLAGKPLLKSRLSEKQWAQLLAINDFLSDEYRVRRDMLLKRLDVTIQSFKWSELAKNKENKIAEVYQPIRKILISKTDVGIPQILAARDDLTRLQKTSSGEAREKTKCAINKILIGNVPDRGGRAWELEPPPPEMPSFTKRDAGPQGGGAGYRGGRGGRGDAGAGRGDRGSGRGGRVQSGWGGSDAQVKDVGGNWNQGGGGYHQGGNQGQQGGYQQGGYQQGGYQQGGYQQGGYQQGGYQQGGYQQGGYQQSGNYAGGYQQDYYQDRGGGRGGGRGGRGRGGRGRH
ncbi:protein FAM98A-like [Physella acuta]|uniref:protein FAM98A-like n=1 Tax=Physella acuta TaxID=109671 RepID=UPI0027DCA315|nr:protein FAM98A-like [Physella acuta]